MLRHCAFFRFKADVSASEAASLLDGFVALAPKLQGVLDIQVGKNISPEGLERGFLHGLIMDFESMAALENYLNHPSHLELAARLLARVDGGAQGGVMVFDMPLPAVRTERKAGSASA